MCRRLLAGFGTYGDLQGWGSGCEIMTSLLRKGTAAARICGPATWQRKKRRNARSFMSQISTTSICPHLVPARPIFKQVRATMFLATKAWSIFL
jgi:hypothetical protein